MSKADQIKARLPRGLADRSAEDIAATERMLAAIRETYELYGFEALETPFIEYTDSLGKFLPDQDRPNEGVFSFQDDDEQWMSLRYDLTAPLARHVAERLDAQKLGLPYRSYRAGWVFRNEKPGPGRFRQFMQFDADTVGSASPAADAEMCMMMADTLERLGIQRGDYVVKISNRKVLEGLLEAVGLLGDETAARRLGVLRAIDKLDRLGPEEVMKLLGPGRKDESGDFTKGTGLPDRAITDIINFTGWGKSGSGARSSVPEEVGAEITIANMEDVVGGTEIGAAGISELRAIRAITCVDYAGRIIIDPSVVRGLEYYTGPVFEAELTFQVTNDDGQPVRFGSVGGGGRYDGLVGRFRPEPVPATGFSIGVSRLFAALKAVKSPIVTGAKKPGPVLVLVMDRDQIAAYQRMVSGLRQAGIRAELYLGSAGMKAQMKYADRRGAPCVIIQGSQERERGIVQIKDLIAGTEQAIWEAAGDKSNAEYRAARLAQSEVPEGDLVAAVQEIIDRHFS